MIDHRNLEEIILEQADAALIVRRVQDKLDEERLKREVFYETIGEDDKAEFVNGEIIYHSPVVKEHNDATRLLLELLDLHVRVSKDGGYVGIEKILTKFTRNDYEPDLCYFGKEKAKDFRKGQLIFPVPDLAVEVLSKSSLKAINHDRKIKFDDYEQHGVQEYWIIDPDEQTVEQHVLENGRYHLVLKAAEGHVSSHAVSGFTIPIHAIFDENANLEALRALLR